MDIRALSFVESNSKWFRCYSSALFETDPKVARLYVNDALNAIHERLIQPGLGDDERQAMCAALRYLQIEELRKKVG